MTFQWPNLARWHGRQWGIALTLLWTFTLTPLGWIQWQQYRMLDDVSNNQVDSIMWQAYQLERELGRLDEAMTEALASSGPVDGTALLERYEIFLSRINLLTNIPRRDLLEASADYASSIEAISAFVAMADPLFAEPQALAGDRSRMLRVAQGLGPLKPLLGDLTREANRAVARFLDERNEQLRQQGLLVIGLATAQIGVMLLFLGLLVRHIRRQQQQYTQLQKLSEQLTEARDQAEAANNGKSVFLANMSHEIRTPFQGLLGMLTLLDDSVLSSQQRDYLQTARDSALHLLGVLNDILDVSTMESGTLKLSVAPIHLRSVVQEVDGLMQVAARDKGLTLNMYTGADLPQWVEADPTRLRQILFNLINNAIKFTLQGGVMVELATAPEGPPGVVLTVRDTGVGMDEETIQRLFTRFYQADSSLRRRIGGTGLGLEISRNLALMMGGDIQVTSQPGVGSVFKVTLVLPEACAPAQVEVEACRSGPTRKLRVLVAEDHPINLKYMSILLDKMGHKATFCENGQQVLQWLRQKRYDVVLLDYHMPVLDGLATTRAIRAMKGAVADIKIILVTADVVSDTRKQARDAGVNEFTSKPLQADDLRRALERCGLLEPVDGPSVYPGNTSPFPLSAYELPLRQTGSVHAPSSPIDTEIYTEIVSMMPEDSMDELLKTLFEAPHGTVHELLQAMARGDREAMTYQAHKLKGSAMLMGFQALVKTTAQVEHLATHAQDPIPEALSQQLRHDMELTQSAARRLERQPVI